MIRIALSILFSMLASLLFIDAGSAGEGAKPQQNPGKNASHHITAYYFHGNFRCYNCFTIEQFSREAIEKYFPEQLKSGKLVFEVINTDEPENEHFIKDYQLYTKSLVVTEFKDGKKLRWTNLPKVWDYIKDRDAFYNYVRTEVQKYLAGS
jgi:hypothetical protein